MPEKLIIKQDERGKLIEIFKIPGFGQVVYSTSKPGVVRGNHYHTKKQERICVIEGKAKISLRNRKTNRLKEYYVSGDMPKIIDMSINWTHNIKNIGESELKLLIWTNEIFNPDAPDTYPETV